MIKKISIVTPCLNEVENIPILLERLKNVITKLPNYAFEIIFIDNYSTDGTRELLRSIASNDSSIKVILNSRNYGHIRSPYFGLLRAQGDAVIYLASDLQDPPELIVSFINEWQIGNKLVLAVKPKSATHPLVHFFRRMYYKLLRKISEVEIVKDFTGFGLYDRSVVDYMRSLSEPYPFLRGIISEVGYSVKTIEFEQPERKFGISKNNFYTLYDIAWLGLISHSKIPLRIASFLGFIASGLSIVAAIFYLIIKLIYWENFPIGIAPLIIIQLGGIGLILIFLGILGEYVGSIHTYIRNRPLVVVDEEINF